MVGFRRANHKCFSLVFFLENPYLRLLSDESVEASVGARPIIMYVIAVDADGTRENQKRLNSSFAFVKSDNQLQETVDATETSFQHYRYILPILEEDSGGSYKLTIGYHYATCTVYRYYQIDWTCVVKYY